MKGWSAICFAAEKTDVQIAKLLYEAGANIGFLDKVYYMMMMFGQCFLTNVSYSGVCMVTETEENCFGCCKGL